MPHASGQESAMRPSKVAICLTTTWRWHGVLRRLMMHLPLPCIACRRRCGHSCWTRCATTSMHVALPHALEWWAPCAAALRLYVYCSIAQLHAASAAHRAVMPRPKVRYYAVNGKRCWLQCRSRCWHTGGRCCRRCCMTGPHSDCDFCS